jgi:hypothetical protein
MNAIRIRKTIESETLHLPELKPLIGRTVEIIVMEEPAPGVHPGTGDWEAAAEASRALAGYDFDAWREQRAFDQRHASDRLP